MEDWKEKCDYSKLVIPATKDGLRVAFAYCRSVAQKMGFVPSEVQDITRAVHEAAENVVHHAFEPQEAGQMEISSERAPEGAIFRVHDMGMPFEPKDELDRLQERAGDSHKTQPTGIGLMFRLMDEVSFNNLGKSGKEVLLVKRFHANEAGAYEQICSPVQRPEYAEIKARPANNEPVSLRLLEPSEAAEVSRAIYKSYGATYFYEHAYYPDRVRDLLETGRQISAVAVTSQAKIIAHCALMDIIKSASSAELGQAVVDPEYRGKGLLKELTEFLESKALEIGLKGLLAQAVTTHRFSQKVLYSYGFNHCGVLLAHAPEGTTFRGVQEKPSDQRESKEILYKYISPVKAGTIYPPPKRAQFIERMLNNIGSYPAIAVPHVSLPVFEGENGEIEVESHAFIPKGFAMMKIKRPGEDIVDIIRKRVRSLCVNKIKVIALFLELSNPLTYHLGQKIEDLGFITTGIMPGTDIGDAMVLQYLNSVRLDFDSIDLYSDEAKRTMDYIRRSIPSQRAKAFSPITSML